MLTYVTTYVTTCNNNVVTYVTTSGVTTSDVTTSDVTSVNQHM